ncbi:MAG TPA: hypothetical protein VNO33_20655 [Kofleriaceae bacterium]|nr:hypothetical protein [Kofleriaceae bacterium]
MENEQAYVELQFCPSPELIPIVRRFVSTFYERLLSQPDAASRLALATHELLENTVKFSLDSVSSIHLGVARGAEGIEISVRTRNRCSDLDRASATAIIDEIKAAPDAFAYYQQVMRKNARRRDGSGLGLARVCAEAEMTLDCEVDRDELILVARARLPGEPLTGTPNVPEIAGPSFAATSSFDGRALTVRLSGNADLEARSVLDALLPRVHSEAIRAATPEVVIDFTELEFMNSSCFRSFVTWLSDVQDLPPDRQYRIRLLSNATMLWQRRSLHALKYFANELVSIES